MLTESGLPLPQQHNRISLGGRGDSFYEYLLKEWIFTGKQDSGLRGLYDAFLSALPALLVEVHPAELYPSKDPPELELPLEEQEDPEEKPDFRREVQVDM